MRRIGFSVLVWLGVLSLGVTHAQQSVIHKPQHKIRSSHRHASATERTAAQNSLQTALTDADPPEVQIGEQLFLETRFAQFFAAHFDGNVNHALAEGDAVMRNADAAALAAFLRSLNEDYD